MPSDSLVLLCSQMINKGLVRGGDDSHIDLKPEDSCMVNVLKFQTLDACQNTGCLPKRPRQVGQTQIRLSDKGLPCLLFCQAFCDFHL